MARPLLAPGAALLLALFSASRARADNTTEDHPCLGVWRGVGHNGGGPPWTIEMTLSNTGARCGGIEYDGASLDCGGPFRACELTNAGGEAGESYTHNVGCTPPGRVTFHCDGDSMEWHWALESMTVQTELRRVRRGARDDTTPPGPTTSGEGDDVPTPAPAHPDEARGDPTPSDRETPQPPAQPPPDSHDSGCTISRPKRGIPPASFAMFLVGLIAWRRRGTS